MKLISFVLFLFIFQAQAKENDARIILGFYYPSLSNLSTKTDIEVSLNFWIQEITSEIDIENVQSILYTDIHQMSEDFSDKKIDLIIAPPLLITLYFDHSILSKGFIGIKKQGKTENLSIITNNSNQMSDFSGKKLLLPENDLLAEMFLNSKVIKKHKQPFHQVFSKINYSNKNQRMVLDVFFGKADVAVIYHSALEVMIELNPQIEKKIKVLGQFPLMGRNYGYFHKDYNQQQALINKAEGFSSYPRGKQILQIFHSNNIAPCLVEYLEPFKRLNNSYLNLQKGLQ